MSAGVIKKAVLTSPRRIACVITFTLHASLACLNIQVWGSSDIDSMMLLQCACISFVAFRNPLSFP